MGLLNDRQRTPRSTLTIEEKAQEMRHFINATYAQIVRKHKEGMKKLWEDPEHLPEDIFEALGKDAEEVIKVSAVLSKAIGALQPTDVTHIPENVKLELPGDGTVNVVRENP